jgi:hypothetical protein
MGNSTYYHWLASGRWFRMTRHGYSWQTARKDWSCSNCDDVTLPEEPAVMTYTAMMEFQRKCDELAADGPKRSIKKGDDYFRDGDRILCTKCAGEEGVPPRR